MGRSVIRQEHHLGTAIGAALSLLFPTWCSGCDAPDVLLCDRCRSVLAPTPSFRDVAGMPVCSGLAFAGIPARILRAVKEEGRTPLARALAPALDAAAQAVLARAVVARERAGTVTVVPVPTSPAAMRRRGYRVVELLAARAGLQPQRMLRVARRSADQRALGVADRERNVAGVLQVSPRCRDRLAGRAVLLVDDIVTTGATLREAARALDAAGADVVGAATVASTPRRAFLPARHT